jgi:valyl-tRNA synthetase
VWSWWQDGSIHTASWPNGDEIRQELGEDATHPEALPVVAEVLAAVRKAKSESRRPMRAPVRSLVVRDVPHRLRALDIALDDFLATAHIEHLERVEADDFEVEIEFAATDGA